MRSFRDARVVAVPEPAPDVEVLVEPGRTLARQGANDVASYRLDVVISNGVIDLVPDKDAVFAELFRVLAPGGRLQIADVTIQNPVSEEGRRNIDLWTG